MPKKDTDDSTPATQRTNEAKTNSRLSTEYTSDSRLTKTSTNGATTNRTDGKTTNSRLYTDRSKKNDSRINESTEDETEDDDNDDGDNLNHTIPKSSDDDHETFSPSDDGDDDDDDDDDDDEGDDEDGHDTKQKTQRSDLDTSEKPSSQQLTSRSSRSQARTSQASILFGSDRLSTAPKSPLEQDLTELNNTTLGDIKPDDLNNTQQSKKKLANKYRVTKYVNSKNEPIYSVSAKAFSQFEEMLFDLMNVPTEMAFNEEDPCTTRITKLVDFDYPEYSSAYISDIRLLNSQLDFSTPSEPKLTANKNENDKGLRNITREKNSAEIKSTEVKAAKIITVIGNSPNRPRKSVRLLINKRNSENFDQIMSDIGNMLKMDYGNIRKLYTLKGAEVTSVADFYKHNPIYIAVGNEKVYRKDFDLDIDEANLIFANEMMKPIPNFKMLKLAEKYINKKCVSKSNVKNKPDIKVSKTPFEPSPDKLPEDLLKNYKVGEIIGEGNFATVRECTDINTGLTFALKIIDIRKCKGKEYMIENELKILRKAKHPNIVKLVEEYQSEHQFYLIMELLKHGDLLEAIANTTKYTERDASTMVHNIASAVAYLHSLNIAHRDIKLENILIHKHTDGSKSLKLGDFGLAVEINGEINQVCGSPVYVAPEILLNKNYGLEVDIWSLGVITYILLCGFAPFRGDTDEETFKKIKYHNLEFLSPYWDSVSDEAKDLIRRMLERDQKKRIKATEILQHPWFDAEQKPEKPISTNAFDFNKKKPKSLHEDISKNLSESFRRTSHNPAISIVVKTALDKEGINVNRTPILDKVDEHNEDL